MSVVGPAAGGAPGLSSRTAVQTVQRIQQRIIVLTTQYSHVLGQFNMALQRLQTHVNTARPVQTATAWDVKAAQLAAAVDRLAREIEALTDKLDDLVDQLAESRERLETIFGGPAAAATAVAPAPSAPLHDISRT
jgi:chromosome segregation ATPase